MSFINHNFFGGGKSPKKTQVHNMVGRPGGEILASFTQLYCGLMLGMILFSDTGMSRPVAVMALCFILGAYCVIAAENSHNKLGKHIFRGFASASLAAFMIIGFLIFTGYI